MQFSVDETIQYVICSFSSFSRQTISPKIVTLHEYENSLRRVNFVTSAYAVVFRFYVFTVQNYRHRYRYLLTFLRPESRITSYNDQKLKNNKRYTIYLTVQAANIKKEKQEKRGNGVKRTSCYGLQPGNN